MGDFPSSHTNPSHLHVHINANVSQLPQDLNVSILGSNMHAGKALIVPDLRHLKHHLNGDVFDNLLQRSSGAKLGGDVERGVSLVVGDIYGGTCNEELSHRIQLLEMCSQVECSLKRQ